MIVLHIGFPKCGSTSIQHFMALNADRLAAHAVLYPQTGRPRGAGQGPTHAHVNLAWQFLMRGKYSASFGTWEELRALAVQRSDAQIVVSSEAFVQFGPDEIARVRGALGAEPVRIVAYIRDIGDVAVSSYSFFTGKGVNLSAFDYYFDRLMEMEDRVDYFGILARWADVFGWDALHVRSLDRSHLLGGDLIEDFLSTADMSLEKLGDAEPGSLDARNVSPNWKEAETLRLFVRAIDGAGGLARNSTLGPQKRLVARLRKRCHAVATELGIANDKTEYLSAEQRARCRDLYATAVAELNARLSGPPIPGPRERTVPERPFMPEAERIPAPEFAVLAGALKDDAALLAEFPVLRTVAEIPENGWDVVKPVLAPDRGGGRPTPEADWRARGRGSGNRRSRLEE